MRLKLTQDRKRPIHFNAINSDKIELPPRILGPSFHSVTFISIFYFVQSSSRRRPVLSLWQRLLSQPVSFGIRHLTRILSHCASFKKCTRMNATILHTQINCYCQRTMVSINTCKEYLNHAMSKIISLPIKN